MPINLHDTDIDFLSEKGCNFVNEFHYALNSPFIEKMIRVYQRFFLDNIDSFRTFGGSITQDEIDDSVDIEKYTAFVISNFSRGIRSIIQNAHNHPISDSIMRNYLSLPESFNFQDLVFKDFYYGANSPAINFNDDTIRQDLDALLRIAFVKLVKDKVHHYDVPNVKTDSLTYKNFKKVPDQVISAFLNYYPVSQAIHGLSPLHMVDGFEKVTEDTQSLGVGRVKYRYDGYGKEDSCTIYFKVYDDLEKVVRETVSSLHRLQTNITFNGTPPLHMFNDKGFVNVSNYYFLLIADQDHVHDKGRKKMHQRYSDFALNKLENLGKIFDRDDMYVRRMFTLAAFHTEMKNIVIPKRYAYHFEHNPILGEDEILRNVSNTPEYSLVKSSMVKYNKIKIIFDGMENTVLSHNDTYEANWVRDRIHDFGMVGFNKEYSDVEKALFSVPKEKREYYRSAYLCFRELLEVDYGYIWAPPRLDEFTDLCQMIGHNDAIKRISRINAKMNSEKISSDPSQVNQSLMLFKDNLSFYDAVIK